MPADRDRLVQRIAAVVEELPLGLANVLASAFEECDAGDLQHITGRVTQVTPVPRFRERIAELCSAWHSLSPGTAPTEIGLALSAAALVAQRIREQESAELIWTGPSAHGVHLRHTDQALLEVIESARHSLLVVSFAVYRIPRVVQALSAALDRDVRVVICVDTHDDGDGQTEYDAVRALGSDVAQRAAVYVWPREERPIAPGGRPASLHAKCAVADGAVLLVSSANLTEYALQLNMELGVLIRGGELPGRVDEHFRLLIEQHVLRRYSPR